MPLWGLRVTDHQVQYLKYWTQTTHTSLKFITNFFSLYIYIYIYIYIWDRGGTVVKVLCYKSEGHWFHPSWCHWHKILPIALWPWGWLSLWQKWVPGAFPGVKGGQCIRLTTLHLSSLTSWNPLGHSRPVTGRFMYIYTYNLFFSPSVFSHTQ